MHSRLRLARRLPRGAAARAASVVTCVALAACGGGSDSTAPRVNSTPGSLRFDYNGAANGSFAVSGVLTLAGTEGAVASRLQDTPIIIIRAQRIPEPLTSEVLWLQLRDVTHAGALAVCDLSGSDGPTANCVEGGTVGLQATFGPLDFRPEDLVVTVTEVTSSRLRGTFQGTAVSADTPDTLTVTGGEFDVPIFPPGP